MRDLQLLRNKARYFLLDMNVKLKGKVKASR